MASRSRSMANFANSVNTSGEFSFSDLTNTPTTKSGYGITDAFDGAFYSLTGTPTTVSGYGITDVPVVGTDAQAYDSNLTSFVDTFTLPTSDGTSNQVIITNGSGVLSFADQSGGGGGSFSSINVASRSISSDTTISATQSGLSVGPLEIADGVTVTVADGGRFVVL